MAFKKAKRSKVKSRICFIGSSGSGKTLSSLKLAYGMTNDWSKIAVLDTEKGRALLYAERNDFEIGEFLHAELDPPFTVDRYIELMREAEKEIGTNGVLIIDSGSHAWKGSGGVLDAKEQISNQRGKTDFSAWNDAGKIQNKFIDTIMDLDCHVIVTLRSKSEYVQERDPETGKTSVKKLGLAPVQRDDFEYEFMLVMDFDKETHRGSILKDNTFLDAEGFNDIVTVDLGKRLIDWLSNGVEPEVHKCEECGSRIKRYTSDDGSFSMNVEDIISNSVETYGKKLCIDCVFKKSEENNNSENGEQ